MIKLANYFGQSKIYSFWLNFLILFYCFAHSNAEEKTDYLEGEFHVTGIVSVDGPQYPGAVGWSHLKTPNDIFLFTWSKRTVWISKMLNLDTETNVDSEEESNSMAHGHITSSYQELVSENIEHIYQIKGYILHDRIYLAIIRYNAETVMDSISASYLCLFEPLSPSTQTPKLSIIQNLPTHGAAHLELFSKDGENFLAITNMEIMESEKHKIEFVIYKWDHAHMDVFISRECSYAIRNKVFTIDGVYYLFVLQEQDKDGDSSVGSPLYILDFENKRARLIQVLETNKPTDVSYIVHKDVHYLIVSNNEAGKANTDVWGWMYGQQFVKYQSIEGGKPVQTAHFTTPDHRICIIILDQVNATLKLYMEDMADLAIDQEPDLFSQFIEHADISTMTEEGHEIPELSQINTIQVGDIVYVAASVRDTANEESSFHPVFQLQFSHSEKVPEPTRQSDSLMSEFKSLYKSVQESKYDTDDLKRRVGSILQKSNPQNITKDIIVEGEILVDGPIKVDNLIIQSEKSQFPTIDFDELERLSQTCNNLTQIYDDILYTNLPDQQLRGEYIFNKPAELIVTDEFDCPELNVENDINGNIYIDNLAKDCLTKNFYDTKESSTYPLVGEEDKNPIIIKGAWSIPSDKTVFASHMEYSQKLNNLTPNIATISMDEITLDSVVFSQGLHVRGQVTLEGTLNGLDDFSPKNYDISSDVITVKAKKVIQGNLRITGTFDVLNDVNKMLSPEIWVENNFMTLNTDQTITSQLTFSETVNFSDIDVQSTINGLNTPEILNDLVLTDSDYVLITGEKVIASNVLIVGDAQFRKTLNGVDLSQDIMVPRSNPSIFVNYAFVFKNNVIIENEIHIDLINGQAFGNDILTKDSLQNITGNWRFLNDVEFMVTTQSPEDIRNVIEVSPGVTINGVDLSESVIGKYFRSKSPMRFQREVLFSVRDVRVEGNISLGSEAMINGEALSRLTDVWTLGTDQVIPIQNLNVASKVQINDRLYANRINGYDLKNDFVQLNDQNANEMSESQTIKSPITFVDPVTIKNLNFNGKARLNKIQPNEYLDRVIYLDSKENTVYIDGDITFTQEVIINADINIKTINGLDLLTDFLLNGTTQVLPAELLRPHIMVVVGDLIINGNVDVLSQDVNAVVVQGWDFNQLCQSFIHPSNPLLFDSPAKSIRGLKVFANTLAIDSLTVLNVFNGVPTFKQVMQDIVAINTEEFKNDETELLTNGAKNLTFSAPIKIIGLPEEERSGLNINGFLSHPIRIRLNDREKNKSYTKDYSNITEFLHALTPKASKEIIGRKIFTKPMQLLSGLTVHQGSKLNDIDVSQLKNSWLDSSSAQTIDSNLNFEDFITINNLIVPEGVTIFGVPIDKLYILDRYSNSNDQGPHTITIEDEIVFQGNVELNGPEIQINMLNGISVNEVIRKIQSTPDELVFDDDQNFNNLEIVGDITTANGINGVNIENLENQILLSDTDQTIESNLIFDSDVTFGGDVQFNEQINDRSFDETYENILSATETDTQIIHGDLTIIAPDDISKPLPINVIDEFDVESIQGSFIINGLDLERLINHGVRKTHSLVGINVTSDIIIQTDRIVFKKDVQIDGLLGGLDIPSDLILLNQNENVIKIPGETIILNNLVLINDGDIRVDGKINGVILQELYDQVLKIDSDGKLVIKGPTEFKKSLNIHTNVEIHGTINNLSLSDDLVYKNKESQITGIKEFTSSVTLGSDLDGDCKMINNIDIAAISNLLVRKDSRNITLLHAIKFTKPLKIIQNVNFLSKVNDIDFNGLEKRVETSFQKLNQEMEILTEDIKYQDVIVESQLNISLNGPTMLAYWETSQIWPELSETFRYDFLSYYDSHFIYKWVHDTNGCPSLPKDCRCDQMQLMELRKDGYIGDKEILGHFRDFPSTIDLVKFETRMNMVRDSFAVSLKPAPNKIMLVVSSKSISYNPHCTTNTEMNYDTAKEPSENIEEITTAYLLGDYKAISLAEEPSANLNDTTEKENSRKSLILKSRQPLSNFFVSDVLSFVRNKVLYLVIINYYDKLQMSNNVNSYVYKFDDTAEDWRLLQNIPTQGALSGTLFLSTDFQTLNINGDFENSLYLAIANNFDSKARTHSTHSFIYKWIDETEKFEAVHSVHTESGKDVVGITIKNSGYVIFANEKRVSSSEAVIENEYQEPITVLHHDPKSNEFVRIQDLYVAGVTKLDTFAIENEHFLVALSPITNNIFIYKWQEYIMFTQHMVLPITGCRSTHVFWDRGSLYMAVGTLHNPDHLLIAIIRGNKRKHFERNPHLTNGTAFSKTFVPHWIALDKDASPPSLDSDDYHYFSHFYRGQTVPPFSTSDDVTSTTIETENLSTLLADTQSYSAKEKTLSALDPSLITSSTTSSEQLNDNMTTYEQTTTERENTGTDLNLTSETTPSTSTNEVFKTTTTILPTFDNEESQSTPPDILTQSLDTKTTTEMDQFTSSTDSKSSDNVSTTAFTQTGGDILTETSTQNAKQSNGPTTTEQAITPEERILNLSTLETENIRTSTLGVSTSTQTITSDSGITTEVSNQEITQSTTLESETANATPEISTATTVETQTETEEIQESESIIPTISTISMMSTTEENARIQTTPTVENRDNQYSTMTESTTQELIGSPGNFERIWVPIRNKSDFTISTDETTESNAAGTTTTLESISTTTDEDLTETFVENTTSTLVTTVTEEFTDTTLEEVTQTILPTGILPEMLNHSGLLGVDITDPNFHFLNKSSDHLKKFLPKNISSEEVDNLLKGIEEELEMDYNLLKHKQSTLHTATPTIPTITNTETTLEKEIETLSTGTTEGQKQTQSDYSTTVGSTTLGNVEESQDDLSSTAPLTSETAASTSEEEVTVTIPETTPPVRRFRRPDVSRVQPGGGYFSRGRA